MYPFSTTSFPFSSFGINVSFSTRMICHSFSSSFIFVTSKKCNHAFGKTASKAFCESIICFFELFNFSASYLQHIILRSTQATERNRLNFVVRCILFLFSAIAEPLFNNKRQIGLVLASKRGKKGLNFARQNTLF